MRAAIFFTLAAICVCIPASTALSDDETGKFGIKGAAASRCSRLTQMYDTGNDQIVLFGSWLDGYITAVNQYEDDTFDIVPWQSSYTLVRVLVQHCRDRPEERLFNVVRLLTEQLRKQNIAKESDIVVLKSDGEALPMYRATIKRLSARLESHGFGEGSSDPDSFTRAVAAFQQTHNLNVSGLPDQATILTILRLSEPAPGIRQR